MARNSGFFNLIKRGNVKISIPKENSKFREEGQKISLILNADDVSVELNVPLFA